jgi:RepB DNA-primase from phage plasmid
MLPIALKAVQLQLRAMGAQRYELGVRVPPGKSDDGKSHMKLRNGQNDCGLTIGEVFDKLDWCAAENVKGHHVYIRPSGPSQLTLIDDLTRKSLDTLLDTGYTPACVVETSPGNFQAWLKHSWTLSNDEGTIVAKILAERFGGDPNSADWRHFGRLAGFTNPKPEYRLPNGLFPYSQLKFALSNGVIYEKTHEVLSEVEDRLLEQLLEVRRTTAARIGYQKYPRPASELLDYAHFANLFPAQGERHKADLSYPPTGCNEASPSSRFAIPSAPIPLPPPSSTAPKEIKTPISIAP